MELKDALLCVECGDELKTQYLGHNVMKYCRSCGRMTTAGRRGYKNYS
jgi:NMD protein affecting ribosome stability and mRNA decay